MPAMAFRVFRLIIVYCQFFWKQRIFLKSSANIVNLHLLFGPYFKSDLSLEFIGWRGQNQKERQFQWIHFWLWNDSTFDMVLFIIGLQCGPQQMVLGRMLSLIENRLLAVAILEKSGYLVVQYPFTFFFILFPSILLFCLCCYNCLDFPYVSNDYSLDRVIHVHYKITACVTHSYHFYLNSIRNQVVLTFPLAWWFIQFRDCILTIIFNLFL